MKRITKTIVLLLVFTALITFTNNSACQIRQQGKKHCLSWREANCGPVEYIRTTTVQDELNSLGLMADVKAYVVKDKEKGFEYMVWAHHDRPWALWDTPKNWTVQSTYESHISNAEQRKTVKEENLCSKY